MSLFHGPYQYPKINPIAFHIGALNVHWYALAYIAGLLIGRWYCMSIARRTRIISSSQIDDFLVWCTLGIIIGGRLGEVFFYYPSYYFSHPYEIYKIWKGGMSFHGGFVGVLFAGWIYSYKNRISFLELSDIVAPAVPIGLGLGRITNFINNELWGRVTNVSWAFIFPGAGFLPRHPSQIYESLSEGLLLFLILYWLVKKDRIQYRGYLSGIFCIGYALSRSFCEIYRAPEVLQNVLPFGTTWGQWLSMPILIVGVILVIRSKRRVI